MANARISRLSKQPINGDKTKTGLGFGAGFGGLDQAGIVALFKSAADCAIYALPTVAKVQWEFGGPISNSATQKTLGATIDILGSGQNPDGVDEVYHTPGLINGTFQTYVLACAVGVHLEPPSMGWVARGNAYNTSAFSPAIPKPFSPDFWTVTDQAGAWAAGQAPVAPAFLRYGKWANLAFWYMVRAYNLRWTYGSLINILDEQLRDTAYMPPNSQEGSAGTSQEDIMEWARETNSRYVTQLGSGLIFEVVDTLRVGSVSTGGAAPGVGLFTPSRDFEFADVVYGGSDLRSGLNCDKEFRTLTNPYILKPGVPIGLVFEEQNSDLANLFRQQFDATDGFGGLVPAQYTELGFSSGGILPGAGSTFNERTVDGVTVPQQVVAQRAEFKCGPALMSNEIKGWEISEQLADMVKNDDNLRAQICSECGCYVGWAA